MTRVNRYTLKLHTMPTFKTFWVDFIDLVFPRCCEACHQLLYGNEDILCSACLVDLPRMTDDSSINPALPGKFTLYPQVKSAHAFLVYTKKGKVQSLLHSLKYKGREEIGYKLGAIYGRELADGNSIPIVDLIATVPLHKKKKSIRGYNQCDSFAKGLSDVINTPWSGQLLLRGRNTPTQTGKSKLERRENVRDVFQINGAFPAPPKSIILIDDVMTTGATLEACIAVLTQHAHPCEEIHIITIAASHY